MPVGRPPKPGSAAFLKKHDEKGPIEEIDESLNEIRSSSRSNSSIKIINRKPNVIDSKSLSKNRETQVNEVLDEESDQDDEHDENFNSTKGADLKRVKEKYGNEVKKKPSKSEMDLESALNKAATFATMFNLADIAKMKEVKH